MGKPRRSPVLGILLTVFSLVFVAAVAVRVRAYLAEGKVQTSAAAVDAGAVPDGTAAPVAQNTSGDLTRTTAPEGATVVREGSTTRAATRQERFKELLATPPPAPAAAPGAARPAQDHRAQAAAKPPQPAESKSVVARLLQPLANLVSGHSSSPAPTTGTAHQHPPTSSEGSRETPNDDPESDTVPPQLIAIEFNPPQIQDGQETMLIITARDNLSGIRGISGTLTSPSGKALQSFAQQREAPESDRYISRIVIPKDAESGTWTIKFLTMTDNATNMITLSAAQGGIPPTAVLRVTSSGSDASAPTLRGVSVAKRAMRVGEPNSVFVDAQDDKSGIRLIAVVFVSPSRQARIGVSCRKGDGDTWECPMTPPECLDCGDWQLDQVQMQDNANNYVTIRSDNPLVSAVKVNIAGNSCDNTPPVVQSVMVDKNFVVIGQGSSAVVVRVAVSDDMCGVGGVSGHVLAPGTNAGTFFAMSPEADGLTWAGTITPGANAPRGTWRIQSVTVNDKGQNMRIYYSSDPVLARAQFVVK